MENNLYKQAILDAKAIRAGAIANAKASLEEVIGPKINELVRLNLQEDLDDTDDFYKGDHNPETNNYHDDLENRNPQEFPDGDFNEMCSFSMDWVPEVEEAANLALEYKLLLQVNPERPNGNFFISFIGDRKELEDFLRAEEDSLAGEDAETHISWIEPYDVTVNSFSMDWAAELDEAVDLALKYDMPITVHPERPNGNFFISFVGSVKDLQNFLRAEEDSLAGEDAETHISSIAPIGKANANMSYDDDELEEILAELNSLDENDLLNEAEDGDSDESDTDDKEANTEDNEINDDTKVIDITVGDLKEILQSVMGSGSSTDMEFSGDEENSDMNPDKEEDLNLDEILAELEGSDSESGSESGSEKMYEVRSKKNQHQKDASKKIKELNEARKTIKSLSSTLNEVNLLNAKLLYVNKIFKEKTLNESQKLKVIKSFDKATTTREAKNVYEILKESLNTKQKTSLKESIGFASQSRGYIKNNNIIESDPFVSRWQKIAGIKN
jgi:hypothetical protein